MSLSPLTNKYILNTYTITGYAIDFRDNHPEYSEQKHIKPRILSKCIKQTNRDHNTFQMIINRTIGLCCQGGNRPISFILKNGCLHSLNKNHWL